MASRQLRQAQLLTARAGLAIYIQIYSSFDAKQPEAHSRWRMLLRKKLADSASDPLSRCVSGSHNNSGHRARYRILMLEPVVGVEPTTCCLRNSFPGWTELPQLAPSPLECEK